VEVQSPVAIGGRAGLAASRGFFSGNAHQDSARKVESGHPQDGLADRQQDVSRETGCRGLGAQHGRRHGARRIHQPCGFASTDVKGRARSLPVGDHADQAPTTASRELRRAKTLKDRLGKYSLTALTPDVIAKYRDDRTKEGQSASSVRLDLALLSHLYTTAIREWRLGIVYNPVSLVRKPSPAPGRARRLKPAEEKLLIKACSKHSNPMLGWMVKLALYTGMRQGEIQSLTLDQVDLKRRVVRLNETKNGSVRTVPLTKQAVKVMRAAVKNPVRPEDTVLVFFGEPGRDGQRRGHDFKRAWFAAVRNAKIKGFRFHDLRHEAVSRLVEAGLSDQEAASISGHKSMQMLRRYTHLRAEDLVKRLDEAGVR
jgi:integrase